MTEENPLRPEHFVREDESDDSGFYVEPRLVTHIDAAAIGSLSKFYGELIPPRSQVLDLMSSWVSHLPETLELAGLTGLGMNGYELEQNQRLTSRLVHNLNLEPKLPFEDGVFDAAIVSVSVQYLTKPVEVFAEVGRVLKPGAPFAVAYSNRLFPTKAVAIWRALGDREHADLIGLYFRLSGAFERPEAFNVSPGPGSDPMYVVVGRKQE